MDPLSGARALLPFWLPFVSLLALPLGFGAGWLVARVLTPLAARRALAATDVPWIERARLAWPARTVTGLALVVVPAVLGALLGHLGGPLSILSRAAAGLVGGAAALVGYALGTWPTARRLLGGAIGGPGTFLASGTALLLVRAPHVVAAATVTAFIPTPLSGHFAEAAALLLLAAVLALAAALGGGLLAGRALGLLRRDARLERAASAASRRERVEAPRVFVMAAPFPAAFMAPMRRGLVFSQGTLDLLDDEELEAVAARTIRARDDGRTALEAETPGFTARALEKMREATLTPPVPAGGGSRSPRPPRRLGARLRCRRSRVRVVNPGDLAPEPARGRRAHRGRGVADRRARARALRRPAGGGRGAALSRGVRARRPPRAPRERRLRREPRRSLRCGAGARGSGGRRSRARRGPAGPAGRAPGLAGPRRRPPVRGARAAGRRRPLSPQSFFQNSSSLSTDARTCRSSRDPSSPPPSGTNRRPLASRPFTCPVAMS